MSAAFVKVVTEELKNANQMIDKWENKLLAGDHPEDQFKYFANRVDYWSSVAQQARARLYELSAEPTKETK